MAIEKQPISQYLTAEGKKANAVAMILFTDKDCKENYIFLIQKGKQLQTPGGKVITKDAHSPQGEERAEEETYLQAAIREACEEICGTDVENTENREKFKTLLDQQPPIYIVNAAERERLALRAEEGFYDTRTICFYLGTQKLETMRAFLKAPTPSDTDAMAAYLAPCRSIVKEENGTLEVEGKKEKCILSNIGLRITTITILQHREGMLAKIQENFSFSQSYFRGASPAHFQPAGKETIAHEQEQHTITPQF